MGQSGRLLKIGPQSIQKEIEYPIRSIDSQIQKEKRRRYQVQGACRFRLWHSTSLRQISKAVENIADAKIGRS